LKWGRGNGGTTAYEKEPRLRPCPGGLRKRYLKEKERKRACLPQRGGESKSLCSRKGKRKELLHQSWRKRKKSSTSNNNTLGRKIRGGEGLVVQSKKGCRREGGTAGETGQNGFLSSHVGKKRSLIKVAKFFFYPKPNARKNGGLG